MMEKICESLGKLLKEEVFNDNDIIDENGTKQLVIKETQNISEKNLKEFRIVNTP